MNLIFNRNSWHYKIADLGGYCPDSYNGEDVGDICSYTRAIIKAVLIGLILLVLVWFAAFVVVDMVLGIAFSLWFGVFLMQPFGAALLSMLTVGGTILGGVFIGQKWKERRDRLNKERSAIQPTTDSYVKNAYKVWKGKYCARITFVGEE